MASATSAVFPWPIELTLVNHLARREKLRDRFHPAIKGFHSRSPYHPPNKRLKPKIDEKWIAAFTALR
jgi:hypothetical protein